MRYGRMQKSEQKQRSDQNPEVTKTRGVTKTNVHWKERYIEGPKCRLRLVFKCFYEEDFAFLATQGVPEDVGPLVNL